MILNRKNIEKDIIRLAYFESEIELGTNPRSITQAHPKNISVENFGYIDKVIANVEKKINDSKWLSSAKIKLEDKKYNFSGIKFNDELYKPGRGILNS